ncbi:MULTISPECIES: ABC transporter permease [unclassified Mesorhizobium]|uniref:ABC transporter permease n=1 Tax=unclassified Mesorhizobium TaxID=325217 RepID=UPI000AA74401|nr:MULTISPECIES: ABC transporter permease [unclassified Mesorhizobium]MBN9254190.1 ABC transporter permease [Mesorhizobium sp.]
MRVASGSAEAGTAGAGALSFYLSRYHFTLVSLASVVAGVVVWELLARSGRFSEILLPSPGAVWVEFLRLSAGPDLWPNYFVTLRRLFLGLGVAVVAGVPIGLLMGMSLAARGLLNPPIELYRPLPAISYFAILVMWFGVGEQSIVTVLALGGFPPIVLETLHAVAKVRKERIEGAQSMGLSTLGQIIHVILPSCLPQILTGIRVGLGLAYSVVVAAEMVASTSGLGWMVYNASQFVESGTVITGLILMGLTGLALDGIMTVVQRRLVPWVAYA